MKPLSRRSVMIGLAALAPTAAIATVAQALEPDQHLPITPAEYLAEMEANGWRPITISVGGEPRGVFEYCVNHKLPTGEDMDFLYGINCRAQKSGSDFYKRTAQYLFEQGRIGRMWP